jgi:hypothetical protein
VSGRVGGIWWQHGRGEEGDILTGIVLIIISEFRTSGAALEACMTMIAIGGARGRGCRPCAGAASRRQSVQVTVINWLICQMPGEVRALVKGEVGAGETVAVHVVGRGAAVL